MLYYVPVGSLGEVARGWSHEGSSRKFTRDALQLGAMESSFNRVRSGYYYNCRSKPIGTHV